MKNSTTWYNISSPALKCNIAIEAPANTKPVPESLIAKIQRREFSISLATLMMLMILLLLDIPAVYLWLFTIILLCLLLQQFAQYQLSKSTFNGLITLDFNDFSIAFNGERKKPNGPYGLAKESRVGQHGCWLVIESEVNLRKGKQEIYVAKKSITTRDFSRLARFVDMAKKHY